MKPGGGGFKRRSSFCAAALPRVKVLQVVDVLLAWRLTVLGSRRHARVARRRRRVGGLVLGGARGRLVHFGGGGVRRGVSGASSDKQGSS